MEVQDRVARYTSPGVGGVVSALTSSIRLVSSGWRFIPGYPPGTEEEGAPRAGVLCGCRLPVGIHLCERELYVGCLG